MTDIARSMGFSRVRRDIMPYTAPPVLVAVPTGHRVVNLIISLLATTIAGACFALRYPAISTWRSVGVGRWLLLIIYFDAWAAFVVTTITRNGLLSNISDAYCDLQFVFTMVFYLTMRMLVYFYFIERCFVIRRIDKKRLQCPLYLANIIGILVPYSALFTLQFLHHESYVDQGICYMGRSRVVLIPLVVFDVLILIWLTGLFLQPLIKLQAMTKARSMPQSDRLVRLRRFAWKTFIGTCILLAVGCANAIVQIALNREPGWASINSNNIDSLMTVLVLHWMTEPEQRASLPCSEVFGSNLFGQNQHFSQNRTWGPDPERAPSGDSAVITTVCAPDIHDKHEAPAITTNKITVSTRQSRFSELIPDHTSSTRTSSRNPSVYVPGRSGDRTPRSSTSGHRTRGSQSEPVDTLSFPKPSPPRAHRHRRHLSDGQTLESAPKANHQYSLSDETPKYSSNERYEWPLGDQNNGYMN